MSDLLNQASLVYIPSGYKEDTAYTVIPTDGSGDLTFTRASDGTRVNSQGLVERVPWNLLQYSNDFSNAAWVNDGTSETNGQSGYDGSNNAWLLIPSTAQTYHTIVNTFSDVGLLTFSVYAKAQTYNGILLYNQQQGNGKFFNLSNGTLGDDFGTGVISSSIQSVGSGWYRCLMTINKTASGRFEILVSSDGISTYSFAGDGTGGVFIQNAQVNEGSTAKPYFPTTDRLNVPRLDYSGGCPSLLLEPQRTNLVTSSQNINGTYVTANWSGTITNNTTETTSPDGLNNAAKFVKSGASDRVYFQTSVGDATYTGSMYFKAVSGQEGNTVEISIRRFGGGTGSTTKLITLTSDWQRVDVTAVLSGGTNTAIYIADFSSSGNASAFYCFGIQLEAGSYPTSYIPTTSASVTRVADAAYKTGISSLIGQTEGTLFVEFETPDTNNYFIHSLSDGTNNNKAQIEYNSGSNTMATTIKSAGSLVAGFSGSGFLPNTKYKVALSYKINDFVLYVNGSLVGSDTSGAVPVSMSRLDIGSEVGTFYQAGLVNQAVLFPTRLTNAELAALTTL